MLNVVIECHYLKMNHYEITVKTAMVNDAFIMSDGQYSVEIQGNHSTLSRLVKGKMIEMCEF